MRDRQFFVIFLAGFAFLFFSCFAGAAQNPLLKKDKNCHCDKTPKRFPLLNTSTQPKHVGMVKIPAGTFLMGGDNNQARADEFPKHKVSVRGFWMDATEVTNAQFQRFVDTTDYITTAEKKPDWNKLKKQLPPGTPKPPEKQLVAASLVFTPPKHSVPLNNPSHWWSWVPGANWRHPQGPNSTIINKKNYPVVQVSWEDAKAYCHWLRKRLPTEAEWERATRGGQKNKIYSWGNEPIDSGQVKANTWQGKFPHKNTKRDGFYRSSPVKSFPANGYGLYDMAGNAWEWTADYYHHQYYAQKNNTDNPKGPKTSYDPREPNMVKRVIRGGSYLCNEAYCSGYRASARMKTSPDTSMEHLGFRCVTSN